MVDLRTAIAGLDRIDWNFPRSGTSDQSVHSLHWFPGNFIPQIPSALIQILSAPGETVGDPFVGSGTTAVEAARLGRRCVASDVLSACVFVSRGKVAVTSGALAKARVRELIAQLTFEHECVSDRPGTRDEGAAADLSSWFHSTTLAQLRYLWSVVESEDEPGRDVLALVFSDVLFACASPGAAVTASGGKRRHHWGWVADNVRPRTLMPHNAIALFRDRLERVALIDQPPPAYQPELRQGAAQTLQAKDASIDLIVTSPPYLGVIDYAHANRLLYAWMNWDLKAERNFEIGARYRRNSRTIADDYRKHMENCWQEMARVLKPGAYAAIVIGESRKFPGTVDTAIGDLEKHLTLVWGPIERHPTRRRVSDRAARPSAERVFVLRKS